MKASPDTERDGRVTGRRLHADTPAGLGFRMPAEWERHAGTWLAWPRPEAWEEKYPPIPCVWVEMVKALIAGERVHLLVDSPADDARVQATLQGAGVDLRDVDCHVVPTDDNWLRDNGPTFVVRGGSGDGNLAVVNWKFNAWGEKYPSWENDDAVPRRVAALLGVRLFEPGRVMEGGSFDVNGRGIALTTKACLLGGNRNPGRSRADLERVLCDYLGVHKVLWLAGGIAGDDTDGHVDQVARFVSPTAVVAALEDDPKDENYESLRENFCTLRAMTDRDGRPLEVIPLPMPEPICDGSRRLPASYLNFYIANAAVLVPVFGSARDAVALDVLRRLFPARRVVGIRAGALLAGYGAIHCVTQQQPLTG